MNNIFKKPLPEVAPPALPKEEPLSTFAGAFAARIEKLEFALTRSEELARSEQIRADTAEATIVSLKREFDHIREGQDKEMNVLRNHCDHWHDEAVKLRSRIDAIVGPLLDVLRPAPAPKAPPLEQPEEEHMEPTKEPTNE